MTPPFDAQTFATLIERGVLQIGDGHRAKQSELGGGGPIFLRAGLVSDDGLRLQGADRFREGIAIPRSKFAEARDTFVTTKGNSLGRTGYMPSGIPQLVYSPHLSYWRSLDRATLHPEFLRYWAKSPAFISQLHAMGHGTDMAPYLSLVDQKRLVVGLPPIEEQRSVASVLGALDDKIDGNRRLAGLLEETAATLFRARFVDFVGVEEFEESEIGRIPRGWRVGALTDLARFVNGKAFTKHANGCERPILRISELNGGVDESTPLSDIEAQDDFIARFDDILFAWSGSLGVYRWPGEESLINQHIFKVIPNGWPAWFALAWIEEHMETFRAIARDKATTMGHIQRRHLDDATLPLPPADVIREGHAVLGPIDCHRAALVSESRTLAFVRDALLPKLVSGQIRVPETADPAEVIGPAAEALQAAATR
jgi:type I restriction enzyme S subunit